MTTSGASDNPHSYGTGKSLLEKKSTVSLTSRRHSWRRGREPAEIRYRNRRVALSRTGRSKGQPVPHRTIRLAAQLDAFDFGSFSSSSQTFPERRPATLITTELKVPWRTARFVPLDHGPTASRTDKKRKARNRGESERASRRDSHR